MKSPKCPFCEANNSVILKDFKIGPIANYWKEMYDIDVEVFFKSDHFSLIRCSNCNLKYFNNSRPAAGYVYDKLQKLNTYYEADKNEFEYVIDKIIETNSKSILDIGCGEGFFLNKIKKSYQVAGTESCIKSIEKLKEKGISLDNTDSQYIFITCFQVLEHIEQPKLFLETILKRIADKGYLFISVPNPESNYFREVFDVLDYPPHHMTQWNKKALDYIGEMFDLEIMDYYTEPQRIEHYMGILRSRRNKINNKKIINRIGMFFDRLFAPVAIDFVDYEGHTHGMLFRKR